MPLFSAAYGYGKEALQGHTAMAALVHSSGLGLFPTFSVAEDPMVVMDWTSTSAVSNSFEGR
jgi:hypothetical protein